jgi:hypothetical protein
VYRHVPQYGLSELLMLHRDEPRCTHCSIRPNVILVDIRDAP